MCSSRGATDPRLFVVCDYCFEVSQVGDTCLNELTWKVDVDGLFDPAPLMELGWLPVEVALVEVELEAVVVVPLS